MSDAVDQIARLFELIRTNTLSTVLTLIGLLLLIVAVAAIFRGLKSEPEKVPGWLKGVLFIALFFGIVFSVAGPSLTLLRIAENTIPMLPPEQAFDKLEKNEFVEWLIRLVSYDPDKEPHLAVSNLKKIGPERHRFSFLAP